jgi:hypothetical protein
MGTAELKNALIEKVKSMKKREVAFFYGRLIEDENFADKDFYKKWDDIPETDRKNIDKGLDDLVQGKKRTFDSFTSSFKKKYQVK